jgi:carboxylesterase type B
MRASRIGRSARTIAGGLIGGVLAWLVLGMTPVAMASSSGGGDERDGGTIARVDTGLVRGARSGGVDSFLGVPYAQPPTGDLRWRAPRPAMPWSGVRDALAFGNRCPAAASTNGPRSEAEDCLFLNVQRPANARPGDRLPVYFWIHGGGLVNGSSNQHDGSLIVRDTGIVVVTINYRLGLLGFMAHPALTSEAGQSGNYGLLDQQAALRWVQRNIAAFGGDPRQVTVGGESAGGFSVCAHLSAPGSRGLFVRAIVESGSCLSQTLGQAEATGTSIALSLGCTDAATAARCLRGQSAARLVDATAGARIIFVRGVPVLPPDPDVAVRTGDFAHVPVLVGANRDEGRTFSQGFIGQTRDQYIAFVRSAFGTRAAAVLAQYPWPATADAFTPAYLVGAIFTDSGFIGSIGGCANRGFTQALAQHTRTFAFEFDHRTGPGLNPKPAGYVWGAGHAAELAYMWPSFDNGVPIAPTFDRAERRLATDMVHFWGSFVRTGRPSADDSARWRSFDTTGRVMSLRAGGESTLISDAEVVAEHDCAFWTPAPATQP